MSLYSILDKKENMFTCLELFHFELLNFVRVGIRVSIIRRLTPEVESIESVI